jgi:glycosyltransferase involved in cell wall biosynthesis
MLGFARLFPAQNRLRSLAFEIWHFIEQIPDQQRWWVPRARRAALDLLDRAPFDAVLSFGNPMSDHLVGLALKRDTGLPWVAHFSDPWVDNPFWISSRPARRINLRLEREVVANADRVVFVSEATRDLVMAKYPADWRSRSRVLPHYFDPGLYPPAASSSPTMVFRHLGTLYGPRTPEPLFRALARLKKRDAGILEGVTFEMVGPCYPPSLMDGWLSPFDLEATVTYRPTVPYLRSLNLMAGSNALILMDAPAEVNVFLPSKLIDYVGAGRPVLGITPARGPSADLIGEAGGIVIDPGDTDGIADAVRTYVDEHRAGTLTRRAPDDRLRSRYDVNHIATEFRELVDEAIVQSAMGNQP